MSAYHFRLKLPFAFPLSFGHYLQILYLAVKQSTCVLLKRTNALDMPPRKEDLTKRHRAADEFNVKSEVIKQAVRRQKGIVLFLLMT